jgi:hypothetical protein
MVVGSRVETRIALESIGEIWVVVLFFDRLSELALPFAYCITNIINFCGGKCNNCITEVRDCTFESLGQEEGAVAEGVESEAGEVLKQSLSLCGFLTATGAG